MNARTARGSDYYNMRHSKEKELIDQPNLSIMNFDQAKLSKEELELRKSKDEAITKAVGDVIGKVLVATIFALGLIVIVGLCLLIRNASPYRYYSRYYW